MSAVAIDARRPRTCSECTLSARGVDRHERPYAAVRPVILTIRAERNIW
jgi:hypothetical protein